MNRIEKYTELMGAHRPHQYAAALGLIRSSVTLADSDAEGMAEVRDILAALELVQQRLFAELTASIAEAKLDGGAS